MINNVTGADCQEVLRLGKTYGSLKRFSKNSSTALKEAATLYAVTLNPVERQRVMWWWVEGVRDYAWDSDHVVEMSVYLKRASSALENGN